MPEPALTRSFLRRVPLASLCVLALAAPALAQAAAPTDEEIQVFCAKVEETMASGDPSYLDGRLDMDALLDAASEGVEASANFDAGFRAGVRQSGLGLGRQILAGQQDADGTYTFLRMLSGQPPRALFRMASDLGLNYHEFHLQAHPTLGVVYTDIYVYLSGERMSETLGRIYMAGAIQDNRGLLEKLLGWEADYFKAMPQIQRLSELVRGGQHEQALEIYAGLPESVQAQNEVLILRLQAASLLGDEAYSAAILAFERAFPGSPALDLIGVDGCLMAGDFPKALELVDRLDQRLQGDPYLEILRGNVHAMAGDFAKARASLERAVEREPGLDYEACFALVAVSLTTGDHAETARLLTRLEREHGVEFEDLSQHEAYAEFTRSPEHKVWLEQRKAQRE